MRVTLIHNPGAGGAGAATRGQLEALIREAGHRVTYRSIRKPGWRKALEKPGDVIAVAGGDGTVGAVVRCLAGSTTPIAVLPFGAANNISRTLGIADQSVLQLIPSWKKAKRIPFDAGIARGPWGERLFIEGVGAGVFPLALPRIERDGAVAAIEDVEVKLAYTLELLREHLLVCPATELVASIDGKDVSGRYLLFETLLMQYIGPKMNLAPATNPNDGKFDLVVVAEEDRKQLCEHVESWQEGMDWPAEFVSRRAKNVRIEWTGFPLHLDDRLWPPKRTRKPKRPVPIELSVVRKAVTFLRS